MSLNRLNRHLSSSPHDSNHTLPHLPPSALDALIPGYSLVSSFLLTQLGLDISYLVSTAVLAFALATAATLLSRHASSAFLRVYSASITLDMHDPLFEHVLAWASQHESLQAVRSLRAHTAGQGSPLDSDALDPSNAAMAMDAADNDDDVIFNFNDWAAKCPPRYEPHASSGLFWHRTRPSGRWHVFQLQRERERIPPSRGGWGGMQPADTAEKLTLTVLGRSTGPLKEVLIEARDRHLQTQTAVTVIRRPSAKEQRGGGWRGRGSPWQRVAVRPSRPMSTVVLDDVQKAKVLRDVNEFLRPDTPRWYADRGIPYRRGYLFCGPPGTGKTSLSFAMAGVFGLDVYCLALSGAEVTEEEVIVLFNGLPRRCVVLLEDIDSAGVVAGRRVEGAGGGGEKEEQEGEGGRRRGGKGSSDNTPGQGISLSGLLNAIDGVASQEGRVLVMTTNYPERLDAALIRPGRVDMTVEFALASRNQVRELFVRMYCVDVDDGGGSRRRRGGPTRLSEILPSSRLEDDGMDGSPLAPTPMSQAEEVVDDDEDIQSLATKFAAAIPNGVFSPAEIQGFLLTRKKSPGQAVRDVRGWRDGVLGGRRKD